MQNASVIVREDEPGKQVLVGYVSPADLDKAPILAYAATKLPPYMVPQVLVMLESFPLTNNGKIDRRQLPVPDYVVSFSRFLFLFVILFIFLPVVFIYLCVFCRS